MRVKRYAPPRFLAESKSEDSKIAAERAVAHICGYGGNGRLGGFRFLCREACGFESHYPYQNEHHPCFEIFYRNTDGFLFGKPRGTRLSAFFVYSLCISGNIKNAKMFLYASVAIWTRLFDMTTLICRLKRLMCLVLQHLMWANLVIMYNKLRKLENA